MSKYIVYSKDGLTQRCEVASLEYHGEWMGACNVTLSISSHLPIDFQIGDYVDYRGERFTINYDPTELKQASKNSYGEAFKYENIVFNSYADELTRCMFLDYVKNDNGVHYSSLPVFSFYAENISYLADRIQVNLDRIYKDDEKWTIEVHPEYVNVTNKSISINSLNVWDALALVKSEFDANFIIRGRKITIGTEGIAVDKVFSYGKGNGLYSIEKNAESDQQIVTRLRAYGSTRNLPYGYYKNLDLEVYLPVGEYTKNKSDITFNLGQEYNNRDMFTNSQGQEGTYTKYIVRVRLNEVVVGAMVALNIGTDSYLNINSLYESDSSKIAQFLADVEAGYAKIYFEGGVDKNAFPTEYKEYSEYLPNNMAVSNLMLPSFPKESLDPYIDSENITELGVREGTIFFDGSGELEEIYPSLEGMTAEELINAGVSVTSTGELDVVVEAEQIEDDGIPNAEGEIAKKTFTITIKDIGFDINEYVLESPAISMKDGMCGGREFGIDKCEKQSNGNYLLTCQRVVDNDINMYFPYKYFNIQGGDKFVLTGINMPDVYVQAASQRLLEAANAWLAKNDYVRYTYEPKVDEIFMAKQHAEAPAGTSIHDTIKEGDLMIFEDADLGIEGSVIIDSLSINENEDGVPTYEIVLREDKVVGAIQKIQNQIDSIVAGGVKGGGGYNSSQINSLIKAYGEKAFLSKEKPDLTNFPIKFLKGLEVGKYETGTLGTGGAISIDEDNNSTAEFDYLKIRKKATFTEISVKELKHVGGEIILTPAAMICSKVEETAIGYKCYFNRTDSDGNTVDNEFVVGDYARCQTFNLIKDATDSEGNVIVGEHVSANRYYWRYVEEVGDDYIVLSKSWYDTSTENDIPQVGDNISQLGNMSDTRRQNAIILSAYGDDAPSYKQYVGIDDFSLSVQNLVTMFSPNNNKITGNFISELTGKGFDQEFEKIKVDWDKVLEQTDKEFTMWFYPYEPTLTNYPAIEWNNAGLIAMHDQDLFYNTDSGRAYRFENGAWVEVTDLETIKALEAAAKAQQTADYASGLAEAIENRINSIVSDGILSAIEKKQVRREFEEIMSKYAQNIATAKKFGVSVDGDDEADEYAKTYHTNYIALGTYMNGGSDWNGTSIPSWIADGNLETDQTIDASAYRSVWTAYYNSERTLLNYLTELAKKVGDDVTTKLDNIVKDGVLSALEKKEVLKEFQAVMSEYAENSASAEIFGVLEKSAWTAYRNAYIALGTYMNGGTAWDGTGIPSWLSTDLNKDTTISAEDYRSVWVEYYEAEKNFSNYLSQLSKDRLDEIASDGILSVIEKKQVLVEWKEITSVYPKNIANAEKYGVSATDYTTAYTALGTYLNNGDTWNVGDGTPAWLADLTKNQAITPATYVAKWTDYYDAESELLEAITDALNNNKIQNFVGATPPVPPYNKGDRWCKATYYVGDTKFYDEDDLVCIRSKERGESFEIGDWEPVSYATTTTIKNAEGQIDFIASAFDKDEDGNAILKLTSGVNITADAASLYTTKIDFDTKTGELETSIATIETSVDGINTVVTTVQGGLEEAEKLAQSAVDAAQSAADDAADAYGLADEANGKAATAISQSNKAITILAVNFDDDGNVISSSGLVTSSNFNSLFTQALDDETDIVKRAELATYVTKDANDYLQSGVRISADQVDLNAVDGSIIFNMSQGQFFKMHDDSSLALLSIRNDSKIGIFVESYGNSSCALQVSAGSDTDDTWASQAISSTGSCNFSIRSGETIIIGDSLVGIQVYSDFMNINSFAVGNVLQQSGSVSEYRDFVLANGDITLPSASGNRGKVIFVKMLGNHTIKSSSTIYRSDSTNTYDSESGESFNTRALFFISNGTAWYEFTCYSR